MFGLVANEADVADARDGGGRGLFFPSRIDSTVDAAGVRLAA